MVKNLLGFVVLSLLLFALFLTVSARIQVKSPLFAPIPDYVNMTANKQVTLLDLWAPLLERIYGSESPIPTLSAKSVLMYDLKTAKVLYERQPKERLPMASLTKIMTAIVSLENKKEDNKYYVNGEDLVGEDSMGLSSGEVLSQEELLYGLMLPSGNDAAEVLAGNFPGGKDSFLAAMNNKSLALGLTDTHFSNASGLQGDGVQYTTASDLLVITKYALENFSIMRQIVATYEFKIPATLTHKEYHLFNETNLLSTYPGVKGVKTGYTPEAGMCLISYLDYGGHQIIGIILNSENRRQEMKELLDYSLHVLSIKPPEMKNI